jgi:hypothetical protein
MPCKTFAVVGLSGHAAPQVCQYLHFCTGKASKLRRILCTWRAVCALHRKASKASKLSSKRCTWRAVCELLHRPATFRRISACSFPTLILRPCVLLPHLRREDIRQHTSAYVSIRQAYVSIRPSSASEERGHTSAYVSIRQAYVSIRPSSASEEGGRPNYV